MIRIKILLQILLILFVSQAQADKMKTIEQKLSDTVITTKIKTQFTKNRCLNPLKISVSTHEGVVSLIGHAKNKEAYVQALRLVTNTKGVKAINSTNFDVNVVNSSLHDAYITAKIETSILKAKVLDDESIPLVGINTLTTNGIVRLEGSLSNEHARSAILKRVARVKGVKKIISNLNIIKTNTPSA